MMGSNVVSITSLGIRIFTFICLLVSLVLLATNKLLLIDGIKITYSDIRGYRYVLSIAIISLSYTILQMGLCVYHLVTKKIAIWPELNLYSDQVITWVLASAVGAGFAVTVELQRFADEAVDDYVGDAEADAAAAAIVDEQKFVVDDFFNKGNTASAILLVAFISMAILVLLHSSFYRTKVVETKAEEAQDVEAQPVEAQPVVAQPVEAQPVEAPSNSN